ncbi:alpha/beta hydrolase family protein [Tabrizicola flagellatus]|uniref:alpha/beta hydrolase family protein n=1 Tax=Tabrizicola flagellatus TaxID=2593021 RepID=UPI0011F11EEE|nr:alpha/beta fold hydrolase [Tabrizicola flagellatus]
MLDATGRVRADAAEELDIRSEGAVLRGRLVLPQGRPRAALVLHGATGAPAGYYRAFADWAAAERDLAVLTYDYRDFGASQRRPMRASRATLADWGRFDQAAALAELARRFPDTPLWVLGHSVGGLWLGWHPAMVRVERAITLGAGLTHVSDHPPRYRWKARLFWSPPVRALARTAGYLPGRLVGLGADLPRGVYEDWRRWCLTPGWHLSDVGRTLPLPDPARVTARLRTIAVADDDLVPPEAVWRARALYPEAEKEQKVLRPADFGLARIGHIPPFARRNAALWPAILD